MEREASTAAAAASAHLKRATKVARREYFARVIRETPPLKIWSLVQWTKARRLDATNDIRRPDGSPARSLDELRQTFQNQFTPAQPRPVDLTILDEIPQLPERSFPPMSRAEFTDALRTTSNTSAPGPDNISWYWLKRLVKCHPDATDHLLRLFNACVEQGVHPDFFKWSITVIIPKPNKADYSLPKAYLPIVLLNCIRKLLEKIIARRMQFEAQQYGVMHPCQFGGTIHHSTTDAGVQLVHNIKQAWTQGLDTSALLLDVSQFYPSIHHNMLTAILRKQGFAPALCTFFDSYLTGRTTRFKHNGALFDPADLTVGVGQGSALSPVLSGLYIAPILHKSTPVAQADHANAALQFFVDDGLISVAAPPIQPNGLRSDQLHVNNAVLAHIFHALTTDLNRVGLGVETDKVELMHFTRKDSTNPGAAGNLGPDLALRIDGRSVRVQPQAVMRYLGFFLDPKLTFRAHIQTYTNKACSAVHAMRLLGNSVRGLPAAARRTLFISNIVPLLVYGAQLWWNPTWHRRTWIAKQLQRAQSLAARWITGCFRTTPIATLNVLSKLIPIRHQVDIHMKRAAIRARSLPLNHPIRASLPPYWASSLPATIAPFPITQPSTRGPAKSPLYHVDWIARRSDEDVVPLHAECAPGRRLIDQFQHNLHEHLRAPKKSDSEFRQWKQQQLLDPLRQALRDPTNIVMFSDGSLQLVKNTPHTGAAWAVYAKRGCVAHGSFPVGKATIYDAEMMALTRGLSRAVDLATPDTTTIRVYVNNKAAAQTVFKCQPGPAQLVSILATQHARRFLTNRPDRHIHVHWCPAHVQVEPNEFVDKLAKQAAALPQPSFVSIAFARQRLAAEAKLRWQQDVARPQALGTHTILPRQPEALCTMSDKAHPLINSQRTGLALTARLARFLSGHFPHGAYRARFHLPGPTACACGAPLETQDHILLECPLWTRPTALSRTLRPGQLDAARQRRAPEATPVSTRAMPGSPPQASAPTFFPPIPDAWLFLQLNPMVASFDWCELLARARPPAAPASPATLAAYWHAKHQVHCHTLGKRAAIQRVGGPGIWDNSKALLNLATAWNPMRGEFRRSTPDA